MSLFISKKLKQGFIVPVLAIMLILPQGMALAQNPPSTAPVIVDVGNTINAAENTAGFTIMQSLDGTGALVGDNIVLKLMGFDAFWQEHTLTEEDIAQNSYNFAIPADALRADDATDGPREIRAFVNFPQEGGGTADTTWSDPLNLTLDTMPPELMSAKITGPNTITLEYSEPVNTTSIDYTSLVLTNVFEERAVTEVKGSTTKTIVLTFDGAPAATNETAAVDIASTVQDLAENALAAIARQVIDDGQAPNAPVIATVIPPDIGSNISSGTAEIGSTVELLEGETSLGTTVTDGSENWFISFDFTTDGEHTLTAKATDAAGNSSTLSDPFEASVADGTPPVITLLGENSMNIEVGSDFTDPGATAFDNFDGDVTAQIQISGSVDTTKVGTYELTYSVTDANNNVGSMVRTVNVVDTKVPVITLTGSTTVKVKKGAVYTDAGATASDDIDGNITESIVTVNPVDTAVAGTYTVTYDVKDTSGNAATQVTRTVIVDGGSPVIALKGDAAITLQPAATYVDAGATASDDIDGDMTAKIVTTNPVNTQFASTYIVNYTVTDSAGNETQLTRTVTVLPGGGSNGPSGSSGTPAPAPTPTVAAVSQPEVLGASTALFHNGEILKLKGSYRYYIFKDGKRVRLPNWKFRESFHGKYTIELDAQTIFGIPYDRTPVDGIL